MKFTTCKVCRVDRIVEPVYETRYWVVTVADDQKLLGRCYVSLKRHCPSLSEMKNAEWADLAKVTRKVEASLKKCFGATMFNWNCYMNDSYRVKPPRPHVHWHVKPRYDHRVSFGGMTFQDRDFGRASGKKKLIVSEALLERISNKIKSVI